MCQRWYNSKSLQHLLSALYQKSLSSLVLVKLISISSTEPLNISALKSLLILFLHFKMLIFTNLNLTMLIGFCKLLFSLGLNTQLGVSISSLVFQMSKQVMVYTVPYVIGFVHLDNKPFREGFTFVFFISQSA